MNRRRHISQFIDAEAEHSGDEVSAGGSDNVSMDLDGRSNCLTLDDESDVENNAPIHHAALDLQRYIDRLEEEEKQGIKSPVVIREQLPPLSPTLREILDIPASQAVPADEDENSNDSAASYVTQEKTASRSSDISPIGLPQRPTFAVATSITGSDSYKISEDVRLGMGMHNQDIFQLLPSSMRTQFGTISRESMMKPVVYCDESSRVVGLGDYSEEIPSGVDRYYQVLSNSAWVSTFIYYTCDMSNGIPSEQTDTAIRSMLTKLVHKYIAHVKVFCNPDYHNSVPNTHTWTYTRDCSVLFIPSIVWTNLKHLYEFVLSFHKYCVQQSEFYSLPDVRPRLILKKSFYSENRVVIHDNLEFPIMMYYPLRDPNNLYLYMEVIRSGSTIVGERAKRAHINTIDSDIIYRFISEGLPYLKNVDYDLYVNWDSSDTSDIMPASATLVLIESPKPNITYIMNISSTGYISVYSNKPYFTPFGYVSQSRDCKFICSSLWNCESIIRRLRESYSISYTKTALSVVYKIPSITDPDVSETEIIPLDTFKGRYKSRNIYIAEKFEKKHKDKKQRSSQEENGEEEESNIATNYRLVNPVELWATTAGNIYTAVQMDPSPNASGNIYNLFNGFAVQPLSSSNPCPLLLNHIKEVWAKNNNIIYNWILDWFAHAVQCPQDKPGTSIQIRGEEGTGKGVVMRAIRKIFGTHCKHVINTDHVTSKFNAFLMDCIFLFIDEAHWGNNAAASNVLKGLITEDKVIAEKKYVDCGETRNYLRIVFSTNMRQTASVTPDSRRFLILDADSKYRANKAYFKALVDEIDDRGAGELLHFLLNRDISESNIRAVPTTTAFVDNMLQSDSMLGYFFDAVKRGRIMVKDGKGEFNLYLGGLAFSRNTRHDSDDMEDEYVCEPPQATYDELYNGYLFWNQGAKANKSRKTFTDNLVKFFPDGCIKDSTSTVRFPTLAIWRTFFKANFFEHVIDFDWGVPTDFRLQKKTKRSFLSIVKEIMTDRKIAKIKMSDLCQAFKEHYPEHGAPTDNSSFGKLVTTMIKENDATEFSKGYDKGYSVLKWKTQ